VVTFARPTKQALGYEEMLPSSHPVGGGSRSLAKLDVAQRLLRFVAQFLGERESTRRALSVCAWSSPIPICAINNPAAISQLCERQPGLNNV